MSEFNTKRTEKDVSTSVIKLFERIVPQIQGPNYAKLTLLGNYPKNSRFNILLLIVNYSIT